MDLIAFCCVFNEWLNTVEGYRSVVLTGDKKNWREFKL